MKKTIAILTLAMLAVAGFAQSNPSASFTGAVQQFSEAVTSATNWTAIAGYGRSTAGNKNVAFADVAYNFNQNVGIVIGYDYLWAKGQSQANVVKGGVTLSATVHPFAFLGSTFATNIVATPFVADLLATPKNNSGIGNIITTGINFDVYSFKNFELGAGVQMERRYGQGYWNGNYWLGHIGVTRKF
jgi:hypothetical protein